MKSKMHYRYLGKTGLTVSAIGIGNVNNSHLMKSEDQQKIFNEIVTRSFELGINFFDTAEMYGNGKGEEMMGKALLASGQPRSNYIVTTKFLHSGSGFNEKGLSRKHLMEGINASLKRMNLEYVDIVYAHRFDKNTPMEEICRSFNRIIEDGKAFYWGTSMWSTEEILKAYQICDKNDLIRPVVEQPDYSMLYRGTFEVEYAQIYEDFGMGTTIYSPLAGGLLTGKYNRGKNDQGSRYSGKVSESVSKMVKDFYFKDENSFLDIADKLNDISKELKCTMPQLALAWVLMNKNVSVSITGASNIEQLEDSCKAIDVCKLWSIDLENKIEKILNNCPIQRINWDNWQPYSPIRPKCLNIELMK